MGVTRKIKGNDLENAVSNLLENKETPAPAKAGTPAEKEKKVSICFQMNESTKIALDNYCKNNDMTLTAGIKKAIREMIENN